MHGISSEEWHAGRYGDRFVKSRDLDGTNVLICESKRGRASVRTGDTMKLFAEL